MNEITERLLDMEYVRCIWGPISQERTSDLLLENAQSCSSVLELVMLPIGEFYLWQYIIGGLTCVFGSWEELEFLQEFIHTEQNQP